MYFNCDDPRVSNFFHYFSYNFEDLGLKKLITTCYQNKHLDLFSQHSLLLIWCNSPKAIYQTPYRCWFWHSINSCKTPLPHLKTPNYPTKEIIYIESVEVCAIKDLMPHDGPFVFTGKAAIYFGKEDCFDDGKGHVLLQNQPLSVCDKTASALGEIAQNDLIISGSTFHYDRVGCC